MATVRRTFHDVATLAARIGVGGIFFANGWDKLEAGLNATTDQFARLDAPLPYLWAAVTMLVELLGGAMLIAGFIVPVCGILLFAEALAVFIVASGDQGQPLTGGDTNLIVALGAASVLLSVTGAGRASVDHMVVIKRREAGEDAAPDPDAEADEVIAQLRGRGGERQTGSAASGTATGSAAAEPAPAQRQTTGEDAAGATGETAKPTAEPTVKPTAEPAAEPPGGGASGEATAPVRARRTRQRRTGTGSEGATASRSEAPAGAGKGGGGDAEKGDKLVAGERTSD